MIKINILPSKIKFFQINAADEKADQVEIAVIIKAGSRFEGPQLNGLSHLIEHLLIGANKKYAPYPSIDECLEDLQTDFSAKVNKEYSIYTFDVPAAKLKDFVPFLRILFQLKFSSKKLTLEKKSIIEEFKEFRENDPQELFEILLEKKIFGSSSLALDYLGEENSINNISQNDLLNFYHNAYHTANAVMGAYGSKENIGEFLSLINNEKFLNNENRSEILKSKSPLKPIKSSITLIKDANFRRNCIRASYIIDEQVNDRDELMLIMIQNILLKKLFHNLRKPGLVYDVETSFYGYYPNVLLLNFDTQCQAQNADKVIQNIKLSLKQVDIDEKKFLGEKNLLKKEMKKPDPFQLLEWTAYRVLYFNQALSHDERKKVLDNITYDQFSKFYKKRFSKWPISIFHGLDRGEIKCTS